MVIEKITDIIIYAGIVQGFYLALLLCKSKSTPRSPNTVLAALLIIMSLAILHSSFTVHHVAEIIGRPIKIMEPFVFLMGPMLYFYTRRLIGVDTWFQNRHAFHLLPFFLFFAINLPFFLHDSESWYANFFTSHTVAVTVVVWGLLVIQYGAYFMAITHLVHIQMRKARAELSNIENTDPSWIRFFMILFLFFLVFFIVVFFSLVHFGGFVQFERAICLIFSLSIFALGYKGFSRKVFSYTQRNFQWMENWNNRNSRTCRETTGW